MYHTTNICLVQQLSIQNLVCTTVEPVSHTVRASIYKFLLRFIPFMNSLSNKHIKTQLRMCMHCNVHNIHCLLMYWIITLWNISTMQAALLTKYIFRFPFCRYQDIKPLFNDGKFLGGMGYNNYYKMNMSIDV